MKYLGVTPGSVTILGLINDANKEVAVIIDEDLWKNQTVQYHPLTNTATLVIEKMILTDFYNFQANSPPPSHLNRYMKTKNTTPSVTFNATPRSLPNTMDSKKHAAFTVAKRLSVPRSEGHLKCFDGYIKGMNLDLVPDKNRPGVAWI